MNIDGVGHGRPNDRRGFVHKFLLGVGGKVLTSVGQATEFLPGSGALRFAGAAATALSGGGGPPPPIIGFPPAARLPFGGRTLQDLPESDPMRKNRAFGIAPQDTARAALQVGQNGACPPAVGNRRINAAGMCAPPGFHWNVSGYFRKGGPCSSFAAGFVERGTVLVKNRKMNNANGQAQDRSLKRIERGQDHAKRILRATGWRTISKQSSRELKMRRRSRH